MKSYDELEADHFSFQKQKDNFVKDGFASFQGFFDADNARALLQKIMLSRRLDTIFLSEREFEEKKEFLGTNPRPGRNLAEKLDTEFIFGSPQFARLMQQVVGKRFRVYDYKFVCGIPSSALPDWVRKRISDQLVNNLGPYVKPQYRDMTYFHGIDFHQDIIDYPDRDGDFITGYVYLDTVRPSQAPLHVLPKSHSLGCTIFPHKLEKTQKQFRYEDDFGNQALCDCEILTGNAGDLFIWHSATLHGTQPQSEDESRVSLRILVERNQGIAEGSWLDTCNSQISGRLRLSETRRDLLKDGSAKLQGNTINQY